MNAHRDVDLFLRAHFDVTADPSVVDGQIDAVLTATAGRRQQPAWLAALRSHPMSTTARSLGRPLSTPAWALLVILALLIAITAVGITTGTFRLPSPPIVNGPIAFGRYDAAFGDTVIHIARPDGSGMRVLLPGPNECPQFSPDGQRLSLGFGTVNVDGTDRRIFTSPVPNVTLGCSTWSPDGARLAVEGFSDANTSLNGIFLADARDGTGVTRLTTNGGGGNDVPGDWSPDGRHVAFVRGIAGQETGTIWIADVADGSAREVSPLPVAIWVSWSPDGQWLVASEQRRFVIMRPDGSEIRRIDIPATARWANGPTFSPDGTRLVFNMAVGTSDNSDIYTIGLEGTDLVQVTDTPDDNEYFVDWGVDPR